jgi:hypothetical protein
MVENIRGSPEHASIGETGQTAQNNRAGDQARGPAALKVGFMKQDLQTRISVKRRDGTVGAARNRLATCSTFSERVFVQNTRRKECFKTAGLATVKISREA